MEKFLKEHLKSLSKYPKDWTNWHYMEDRCDDALTDEWLESRTSYIYKVGVLAAIDANKCDWVDVVIGFQRGLESDVQIKAVMTFSGGENDDIGRTLERAMDMLKIIHPVFHED